MNYNLAAQSPQYDIQSLQDLQNVPVSGPAAHAPAILAQVATIKREQATRDHRDAAQMLMAADAVEIDTTALGLDAVVGEIVRMARGWAAVSHG